MCRVWHEGVPPGRQPRPVDCRTASEVAARDRNARVIYGDGSSDGRWGPSQRGSRWPNERYPNEGGWYGNVAFDNGYRDGYQKGVEDVRDDDRFDPGRHGRYKSADRGYDSRYGSKDFYRDSYREGFTAGYSQGYREYRQARR
jgi:hypothetical protein